MFEWNSSYSVGIGSIDAQHQNLFALARELHQAMAAGQGQSSLGRILGRLVEYTEFHFSHEERLMRTHNYPELPAHAAEHGALTAKVKRFQAEAEAGRTAITVELLQFLKDWLQQHIQRSDQKYAPLLKTRAVG